MGFILSIIALPLFLLIYIMDEITIMFINVKNRKWFKVTSERKFKKSFKLDVLANWLFPGFLNAVFSKGGYQFGKFGETLSSVFGKKRAENSLGWFGYSISILIDCVDFSKWRKGGHCFNAIMADEEIEGFLAKYK